MGNSINHHVTDSNEFVKENLEDVLLHRLRCYTENTEWFLVVWYPLGRIGEFAKLGKKEQSMILREYGIIGRTFGEADLCHDFRLNCFGLDKNDNDFMPDLIGDDLHPLPVLVQTMRASKQTSTYIEKLGSFFIGKVIYQSK